MAQKWNPDSWRGLPIKQVPDYADDAALRTVETRCAIIRRWSLPARRGA